MDKKYISRYNHNGTQGWLVRMYQDGSERSKLFSDSKYGGKGLARKAAKNFRDAYMQMQKADESYQAGGRFISSSNRNTSGVIGVSRVEKQERSGNKTAHWQASWREQGKTKTRSFAVSKYGESEAKERAIGARHRAMVRLHGELYIKERATNKQLPSDNQLNNV